MSTSYDLNIVKGDTLNLRVQAKDVNCENIIITSGYSARGYVRNSYGNTGILLDLNPMVDSGNLTSGYIDIDVTASVTAALPVTRAVYDVELYDSSDNVVKILAGRAIISPESTY